MQDGDDWIEELLILNHPTDDSPDTDVKPRFPSLRHLSLPSTSLLSLPNLPLSHLTSLDLSHNLLNAVPSSLSSLSSLRSLNLSYNLITSVRNAPSSLGNISTLNISHNRIDCLVGLDRVLGLERVDVRSNELAEVGEVGRLAVLPHVKEIWTTGNEFNSPTGSNGAGNGVVGLGGTDWRVELGATFAQEGREVVLDDTPFSWAEKRSIDALLSARGRRRPSHSRTPTAPVIARLPNTAGTDRLNNHREPTSRAASNGAAQGTRTSIDTPRKPSPGLTGPHTDLQPEAGPSKSQIGTGTVSSASGLMAPPSPTPSTATATTAAGAAAKKRRPRRLINLDSTEGDGIRGGSMRLPPKSVLYEEEEEGGGGKGSSAVGKTKGEEDNGVDDGQDGVEGKVGEGVVKVKKGRRARVSASMFEPS